MKRSKRWAGEFTFNSHLDNHQYKKRRISLEESVLSDSKFVSKANDVLNFKLGKLNT